MTTATAIPCKRPKVSVDPRGNDRDAVDANCHVPGCSWTYPADKQFMALKSDADWQATRHRAEHRAGVPVTQVDKLNDGGYRASCQCRAIASDKPLTRTDAESWVAYHLSTVHGVVVCS